ncbi:MAG: hypothetical protein ABI947_15180 [Chloroflexota bacterium]
MFEGLEETNWRSLRHSYGSAKDVPELLRAFAEAPDDETQGKAFHDLLNTINHQGDIYSAEAATVPFLIQLVVRENFSKRAWILETLLHLLESCDALAQSKPQINMLRDEFATFISIDRGIPIYLLLLNDSHDNIRALASNLLARLNNQRCGVRLRLWRASEREKNPAVCALMIYGVGNLIDWSYRHWWSKSREQYCGLFLALTAPTEPPIIRLAAALAWIKNGRFLGSKDTVPVIISHVLGSALASIVQFGMPSELLALDLDNPLLSPQVIMEQLIRVSRIKRGAETLAEALQAENMTADVAHIIVREMLDLVFIRIGLTDDWSTYLPDFRTELSKKYIYANQEKSRWRNRYSPDKPLSEPQKVVIEAIVNCDLFWQLPTNLFSFFYGLPDSRDELRRLITP